MEIIHIGFFRLYILTNKKINNVLMKVFAFKPTNELIGKFDIDSFEAVVTGLSQFSQTKQLEPYDYLECSGRTWTLVAGSDGLELHEGRLQRPPQQMSGAATNSPFSFERTNANSPIVHRYREGYRTGKIAMSFGVFIKMIGWILGFLSLACGIILAFLADSNDAASACVIYGVILGAVQVVVFMFFSMLLSAIGQLLCSSIDTAIYTSPFLDEQQKLQAINVGSYSNNT